MSMTTEANQSADADLPPPADGGLMTSRGETTIASGVVQKIAARAATEVEGVTGVSRGGLAGLFSSGRSDDANASASLHGSTTRVSLDVSVQYPMPVGHVAEQVRRHVMESVERLTGLRVTDVDITVPELVNEYDQPAPRRRVE